VKPTPKCAFSLVCFWLLSPKRLVDCIDTFDFSEAQISTKPFALNPLLFSLRLQNPASSSPISPCSAGNVTSTPFASHKFPRFHLHNTSPRPSLLSPPSPLACLSGLQQALRVVNRQLGNAASKSHCHLEVVDRASLSHLDRPSFDERSRRPLAQRVEPVGE
jgi:hypothetical protein